MKAMLPMAFALAAFAVVAPVRAADLPLKAPAPAVPVVYNWTGFYIGAEAGYGFGHNSSSFSGFDPRDTPPNVHPDGGVVVLGGQAGYNYQVANWLVGLETDLAYANLRGSATGISVNGVKQPVEQDINWIGTARGRIGVLPIDRLLVFATGGLAYGGVGVSSSFGPSIGVCGPGNSCGAGTTSATDVGWTVGGGLEYAWTNQISFKAEYLFVDLGSRSVTYPITLAVSSSTTSSAFAANIVRIGLNYRFAPGPVVARY